VAVFSTRGLGLTVRIATVGADGAPLILVARDNNSVQVYGLGAGDGEEFSVVHTISGHQDWVRSMDVFRVGKYKYRQVV
jgi:hypothetical protein